MKRYGVSIFSVSLIVSMLATSIPHFVAADEPGEGGSGETASYFFSDATLTKKKDNEKRDIKFQTLITNNPTTTQSGYVRPDADPMTQWDFVATKDVPASQAAGQHTDFISVNYVLATHSMVDFKVENADPDKTIQYFLSKPTQDELDVTGMKLFFGHYFGATQPETIFARTMYENGTTINHTIKFQRYDGSQWQDIGTKSAEKDTSGLRGVKAELCDLTYIENNMKKVKLRATIVAAGDDPTTDELDYDATMKCPGVCGDGFIDAINAETCDDSNTVSNDGCSNICQIEGGSSSSSSSSSAGFCGDNICQPNENPIVCIVDCH